MLKYIEQKLLTLTALAGIVTGIAVGEYVVKQVIEKCEANQS